LAGIDVYRNVRIVEPRGHLAFPGLMARTRLVLTHSGGIHEEATVLHIPCITLRRNTELPITCELETNILGGTDPADTVRYAIGALDAPSPTNRVPEKWDGHAGERIADVLLAWLTGNRFAEAATAS
jgi:UDP-N-acetylglucosamine 2-epimerase (non-hydrolysing)